jgi:hypothetical protein
MNRTTYYILAILIKYVNHEKKRHLTQHTSLNKYFGREGIYYHVLNRHYKNRNGRIKNYIYRPWHPDASF